MREAIVGANVDNGELFLMETKVFPPLRKKKKLVVPQKIIIKRSGSSTSDWISKDVNYCAEDIYTPMFTTILVTAAKTWEQPTDSLTDEWTLKHDMDTQWDTTRL